MYQLLWFSALPCHSPAGLLLQTSRAMSSAAMIRVCNASGEELMAIPAEESLSVRAMKQRLQGLCGLPRFRQRLLRGAEILKDDAQLQSPVDLQLVLLSFVPSTGFQLVNAAYQGDALQVEKMLQQPEDPNDYGVQACYGLLPLGRAADGGHVEVMRLLLEAKADIDAQDKFGLFTALHWACRAGAVDAVGFLLAAGANKEAESKEGMTPLCMACRNRHPRVVRLLLEAGAHPGRRTGGGITPLELAVGRLHISRLLSSYKWSRRLPKRPSG